MELSLYLSLLLTSINFYQFQTSLTADINLYIEPTENIDEFHAAIQLLNANACKNYEHIVNMQIYGGKYWINPYEIINSSIYTFNAVDNANNPFSVPCSIQLFTNLNNYTLNNIIDNFIDGSIFPTNITFCQPLITMNQTTHEFNTTVECVNFFGGTDVNGISCGIIEDLVWLIITTLVVSFGCCCAYLCCGQFRKRIAYDDNESDKEEAHTQETCKMLIEVNGVGEGNNGEKHVISEADDVFVESNQNVGSQPNQTHIAIERRNDD
eukprot:465402_1